MMEENQRKKELRKSSRGAINLKAIVTWPRRLRCTIVDISGEGARLTSDHMHLLPQEFDLALSADIMRKCKIVWRSKTQCGVKFVAPQKSLANFLASTDAKIVSV